MKKKRSHFLTYFFLGIIILIFIVSAIFCFTQKILINKDKIKFPDDTELYSCEMREDCVRVSVDCCECYQGGNKSVAINKKYEEVWKEKISENCLNISCKYQKDTSFQDWTCKTSETKCIENRCELINIDYLENLSWKEQEKLINEGMNKIIYSQKGCLDYSECILSGNYPGGPATCVNKEWQKEWDLIPGSSGYYWACIDFIYTGENYYEIPEIPEKLCECVDKECQRISLKGSGWEWGC